MRQIIVLTLLNVVSLFLSTSVPGKHLIVALCFSAASYLIFIYREKLLFLGPKIEQRFARMAVTGYAYALAGGYIIVWSTMKVVSWLFPECQPSC